MPCNARPLLLRHRRRSSEVLDRSVAGAKEGAEAAAALLREETTRISKAAIAFEAQAIGAREAISSVAQDLEKISVTLVTQTNIADKATTQQTRTLSETADRVANRVKEVGGMIDSYSQGLILIAKQVATHAADARNGLEALQRRLMTPLILLPPGCARPEP